MWDDLKNQFRKGDNVITQLIIINIAVFVLLGLITILLTLFRAEEYIYIIDDLLVLPKDISHLLVRPWTLVTYMFLHSYSDFLHIAFNMLILFFMGNLLANFLRSKQILPLYIYGGIAGAVVFILAYNIFPLFDGMGANLRGASAGVYAITMAAATFAPNQIVRLFFIFSVKLKWVALGLILMNLMTLTGDNAGGSFSHLGGVLIGYLYVKQMQKGKDWSKGFNKVFDSLVGMFAGRKHSKLKVEYRKPKTRSERKNEYYVKKKVVQQNLDTILDKISQSGYESLTKEEKDFLFQQSRKNN